MKTTKIGDAFAWLIHWVLEHPYKASGFFLPMVSLSFLVLTSSVDTALTVTALALLLMLNVASAPGGPMEKAACQWRHKRKVQWWHNHQRGVHV